MSKNKRQKEREEREERMWKKIKELEKALRDSCLMPSCQCKTHSYMVSLSNVLQYPDQMFKK